MCPRTGRRSRPRSPIGCASWAGGNGNSPNVPASPRPSCANCSTTPSNVAAAPAPWPLSTALGWHPTHLAEVLYGQPVTTTDRNTGPTTISTPTAWSRLDELDELDEHVRGIATRLDELTIEVRTALLQLRGTR